MTSPAAIGGQNVLLAQSLRVGVMAEPTFGIGDRFVDAPLVAAVERDARTARIDQPPNAVREASLDDVPSAQRVGLEEMLPRADHAGDAADVKHRIDPAAGQDNRLTIAQIGLDRLDAQRLQRRTFPTAERPDAIAPGDELFDDVQPQKTAAAGD